MSQRPHVRNNPTWQWGDINCFPLWIYFFFTVDWVIIPLCNGKCCVTCWICCLSYRILYASISSRNTEVHPLPNKSQSTAFLLYTSRHLACNLPVCRGDMRPPNDPNRRHACNCSGWRNDSNDSVFQYLFIHCKMRGTLRSTTVFTGHCSMEGVFVCIHICIWVILNILSKLSMWMISPTHNRPFIIKI